MFDIISIGTATLDILLKAKTSQEKKSKVEWPGGLLCFPLGAKVELADFRIATGGGATNTAVTFSRLGLKAGAVFEVGDDEFGNYIIRDVLKERVETFASINRILGTASSVIVVGPSGERTVLVYRGAASNLEVKEIPKSALQTKWVYIAPGGIETRVIVKLISYCKKNGIKVGLNPSKHLIQAKSSLRSLLKEVDVFLVNVEEASYLTGIPYRRESQIFKKLDQWVKGILVVTKGQEGVKVSDGRHCWSAGVFKNKKVVDRLGAGDAFGAGFVAGLIRKKENCVKGVCGVESIAYAMRLASANATSVVEALGAKAGILTLKEFEKNKRWQRLKIKVSKL